MLFLYLVACMPQDSLRAVLDLFPGSAAYHLGIADRGVPPGTVAEVAELGRLVMLNVRNVATGERDQ
jgi:hypothetical protein